MKRPLLTRILDDHSAAFLFWWTVAAIVLPFVIIAIERQQ